MANRIGTRLGIDEEYSEKYPKFIHNKKTNIFRLPFVWVNKQGKTRYGSYRHIEKQCCNCGSDMLHEVENSKHDKTWFCSKECRAKAKMHPDGHKKNKYKEGSYVMVRDSTHPHGGYNKRIPEHRAVIEKHIGRYLDKTEIVHHINCIKNDNRLENLFLCKNSSQHNQCHWSLNKCLDSLIKNGHLFFDSETGEYLTKEQHESIHRN
jgi:hypothetical protein